MDVVLLVISILLITVVLLQSDKAEDASNIFNCDKLKVLYLKDQEQLDILKEEILSDVKVEFK